MKQVPQNEMDVLLRKLSQVDLDRSQEAKSGHLDPDELNAYAQNALPAMARAEYTEHLADCSMCRRIVTELTPALVPVAAKTEASPSAVREFFSKVTSPFFLRYAVPSLAAVLILALAFLFVNRRSEEMVAVNETQPNSQVAIPKTDQNANPPSVVHSDAPVQKSKEEARSTPKPANERQESAQTTVAVDDLRGQEESAKRVETARADTSRQAAAAPAAAPPAEVGRVAGERELAKSSEVAEKKKAAASEPQPSKDEARKLDDADTAKNAPKPQAAPARRTFGGISSVTQNEVARDRQNKDSKETRRVAGRSFSKVNGVWIDTAYGSQATVNLSRGSEQFRALVADEPDIRTIADQLDGEIIVVLRGRAYRIK